MSHAGQDQAPVVDPAEPRDALERIRTALRGLRYGTVTAVVQDGVIVQVERTEKFRVERREPRRVP